MSNHDDVLKAIETVQAYLRSEFIVEECRTAPEIGCASCQMIDLEAKLHQLSDFVQDTKG